MGFNHNIYSPSYLQLLTRWFQFGAMCPLFRSHGHRLPELSRISCDGSSAGGYNEIWHFAEPFRSAIAETMRLRESLRSYIEELYALASRDGSPVMRMLRYEFPNDATAAEVDDQFMLGSDYLVAPVLFENSTEQTIYLPILPAGQGWRCHFNDTVLLSAGNEGRFSQFWPQQGGESYYMFRGGQHVVVATPLASFPLYKRCHLF